MADLKMNSGDSVDRLLAALGSQLERTASSHDLVVIGGSALLVAGVIERATSDVDLVGIRHGAILDTAEPMPPDLVEAKDRVARDFGLSPDWLNPGPTSLLDLGLPDGFAERLVTKEYGPSLRVGFASRFDQIHLKLYALVDQGPGKHELDLRALSPTRDELLAAAAWARTHDPSPGFEQMLGLALVAFGVEDAG